MLDFRSSRTVLSSLAKKIAKMDDFEYGDKRFEPLNSKLTEVYKDKLNFYMDRERDDAFVDGVSETLYKDSYRAEFEINGRPHETVVKEPPSPRLRRLKVGGSMKESRYVCGWLALLPLAFLALSAFAGQREIVS
jgi:hypothetical protein